jgi:PAS domain-containing protein
MDQGLIWVATIAAIAIFASVAAILFLSVLQHKTSPERAAIFAERQSGAIFLFDAERLIDATPSGMAILEASGNKGSPPWARLMLYLTQSFPTVETQLSNISETGAVVASSEKNDSVFHAELRGGITRIQLRNLDESDPSPLADPISQSATQQELTRLRDIVRHAPFPIWREDENARVVWANAEYLLLSANSEMESAGLSWPLPRLFETIPEDEFGRQTLQHPGKPQRWYESRRVKTDLAGGTTYYALPADKTVAAETAMKDFMQTLTKTFAHLPIGLAIFDRQRQLAMFNPAMMDFSGLPPDFLSMKPTLFAFLDAMRERNMIPEPKDYRTWRRQMTDIEQAASTGGFEDVWSLSNGQTFRVSGRPHPNGALALMFEDISTEMSRTRSYRANLEISQAVIDALDDGVAVFSDAGLLVMANSAYADIWKHDPFENLANGGYRNVAARWLGHSAPTEFWAKLEAFVISGAAERELEGKLRLIDGRSMICRASALPTGAVMVCFRLLAPNSADETITGHRLTA